MVHEMGGQWPVETILGSGPTKGDFVLSGFIGLPWYSAVSILLGALEHLVLVFLLGLANLLISERHDKRLSWAWLSGIPNELIC